MLYAGSVSGGVWKSVNGGTTWTPLDFIANINISTMVMDPLDHNTIYAGTGEAGYSFQGFDQNGLPGAGVFKSTDAGATWNQLVATQNWQYVYRLAMQPGTSDVLLAAVANDQAPVDNGIWRSTNRGVSWSHVYTPLIGSTNVVAFDPNNPAHAVSWGAGCCYYLQLIYSLDGGVTWNNSAMPSQARSFSNVAAAWGPSSNVYFNVGVPVGSASGEVWRSQNNGASYVRTSQQGVTECTAHCAIWVSPTNANLVVVGGISNWRSTDGGVTFYQINYPTNLSDEPHADTHWFVNDPVSTNKFYVCNDGGVYRTNDIRIAIPGASYWTSLNATYQTSQFYAGAGINDGAAWPLVGGTQDNGTLRVSVYDQFTPSYRPAATANQWSFGGDGGYVAIDPFTPTYMYGEYQNLEVFRSTNGGETGSPDMTSGLTWGSGSANFAAPLVMDPNDRNSLLAGGATLQRTTSASFPTPSWAPIRGQTTPASNISAIAVASTDSNIIWVGQNDGRVQKATNGLQSSPNFVDIDNNTPGSNPLPDRNILRIMIDPADAGIVYVALGGYSANSPQPENLWRTTNGGARWTAAAGSGATALPYVPIRSIVRHPRNQQRLYVATDIGIYESSDNGATWSTSQQGPADVSVDELAFVKGSELLLAATHGRGLWTADTSSVPSFAPTGMSAAASGTSSVNVSWAAFPGATSYQVVRSNDGAPYANASGGLVSTTSYTDANVASGKTYLYKVKAFANGLWTDFSSPDLATTITFTDDNALTGLAVRAIHLTEIRTAVNAVLTAAGETPSFVSATAGTTIFATDVTDLRTALITAYSRIGMPFSPNFGETILPNSSIIRASHFQEIRNATK